MTRLDPISATETSDSDVQDVYETKMATLGFVPNSARTLARWPELARAYGDMSAAIASTRYIGSELSDLIFLVASKAAGCAYCQAHSAHLLVEGGMDRSKLSAVWDFESSGMFSEAERAALRMALAAGVTPSGVTDEHFVDLRRFFTDEAIVEIAGIIAFSGFMNRWNATMATQLESAPLRTAQEYLAPRGWTIGPHSGNARV